MMKTRRIEKRVFKIQTAAAEERRRDLTGELSLSESIEPKPPCGGLEIKLYRAPETEFTGVRVEY